MIDDESVTSALSMLERHAPAEDEVIAGMRTGIARRRRRRQVASVAAVAGTAAALALGVVYVAAPGRGADQSGMVGAAQQPTTPAKKATPPAPPSLPFTAGWIPEGYQLESWEAGPTSANAQYVGSKDFQTVVVSITKERKESMAGDVEDPATIAGRPGVIRRLSPGNRETQLIWQLADGRWAFVGGRAPTVSQAMLQRVADNLTATPTPLPAPFSMTTLPDGYQVANWSGGGTGPVAGSLTLCRGPVEPRTEALPADCVHVTTGKGTAPATMLVKYTKETGPVEIPIDQEQTVNGLLTRATADGKTVVTQLDADRYAEAYSEKAGGDLLRQVVTLVKS